MSPTSPKQDDARPLPVRSGALLGLKDVLLLLASIALGVGSAVATAALQAQYSAKQALIERQSTAIANATLEYNRYFKETLDAWFALRVTLLQFREDQRLASVDIEAFAHDWDAKVAAMKETSRKQGPVFETQSVLLHILFTPDQDYSYWGSWSTDGVKIPDRDDPIVTKVNGLRRALLANLPRGEKEKLAVALADAAEPWVKERIEEELKHQIQTHRDLVNYARMIPRGR